MLKTLALSTGGSIPTVTIVRDQQTPGMVWLRNDALNVMAHALLSNILLDRIKRQKKDRQTRKTESTQTGSKG